MADKKISDMSAAGALAGTELVEIVQSGDNVRSTVAAVGAAGAAAGIAAHEADTTSVHGITDTSVLATATSVATAVSNHEADTTAVHGITDTSALALTSAVVNNTLVDAKGDLLIGTAADTPGRLATGTQGQVLIVDTATTSGLAWVSRPELAMAPTGTVANTYPRNGARIVNVATLTSGTLALHACYIPIGVTITNIAYKSGATAAVAPTNWWFGLFDSSRNVLRQTADQTSTAWGSQAVMSVALSSAFVTTYTGLHYFGIMMAAGTVVSLHGVDASAVSPISAAPILCGNSSTGLTTPASCPNPAGAITTQSSYPYAWAT